ncbi:TPA: hypothetical protein N0F65_006794 [Lagenidium giganteum]|uniref:Diaminopimelate decarboxylase n=1 Tax=Lagenidium giganteum TaxID=4803 RepID=A0AAV2ZCB8_9STRA|nr:TPA: hypothetical protein N0F65_006794 [Lagenidium giganteum]
MNKIPVVKGQMPLARQASTKAVTKTESALLHQQQQQQEQQKHKEKQKQQQRKDAGWQRQRDRRSHGSQAEDDVRDVELTSPPSPTMQMTLQEQIEAFHPELLPLIKPGQVPERGRWKLDDIVDAVRLSHYLQDRLLCLPELNRTSPCYSARSIVLLYTKIKYLETFLPAEIEVYASVGDQEHDEVRLLHQLKNVSSNAEMFSRLATLLHIPSHGDMWNEIIKFVACAFPFAEQTESLLIRGSDERSVLCSHTKTNKYNGSTIPFKCDIARASCTCSSITLDGFERCEKLRQELLLNSLSINPNSRSSTDYFDQKMSEVRTRIAACLGVTDLVQDDTMRVLLTPSGTDAELLATSAALARLFSGLECVGGNRKVTCVISAQGEIGRGSSSAAGGKHFSSLTPSGEPAQPGASLRRYSTDLVEVLKLAGRDESGNINCFNDHIIQTVARILDNDVGGNNVVLLHVVMGSKTGYSCPTLEMVDYLVSQYPHRVLVVIDACQMRVQAEAFRVFAQKGYITLITGSKFFGGAPFCGAVLMPVRCVYEMEATAVEEYAELCHPLGLEDYFSKYDFHKSMKHVRARMGTFMNVGLLLRWESALANMEPYFQIPSTTVDDICRMYVYQCKAMLRTWGPMIELLRDPVARAPTAASAMAAISGGMAPIKPLDSIVSFKVLDATTQEHLDVNQLRDLHSLLSKDLSATLRKAEHADLAKQRCLLGQPVQLGKLKGGVLRIALGADMVNRIYYQGRGSVSRMRGVIDELVAQDHAIVHKIQLILENWDLLRQQYIEQRVVQPAVEPPNPLSDWNFSVKKPQITQVVQKMVAEGILGAHLPVQHLYHPAQQHFDDPAKLAIVYDLDAIDMAFQALLTSFPSHFEHRFAMKSCALSFFIKRAIENDVGLECASIVEVQHALRLGCPPHKIVFDNPCKTRRDIAFAIGAGVELNADNFDELQIIREHAEELFQSEFPECTPRFAGHLPRIGLRVNPLLGAGTNECLSVSTVHSKFGIPLTASNRRRIVEFFRENPWMSGIHCHVGSQGCSLEMLARGASIICDLANEIDLAAGVSRVKVLNIGGGLPSNYDSDDVAPTFAQYVDVLRREAPQLFERNGRTILTEFGRSVSSKTAWTISEVEYVKTHAGLVPHDDLEQTAIIHAGSDLFLRTCYRPELFPHRLSVYKSTGEASTLPDAVQNVAGPLCFGGDMLARRITLPLIERGDYVVVHDSGSNTISLFSRHCSRPAPPVYGYRNVDDELSVELLKPGESPEDVMRFWG